MVYYAIDKSTHDKYARRAGPIKRTAVKIYSTLVRFAFPNHVRILLGRSMGMQIGEEVYLGKHCIFDDTYPYKIIIEDKVNISYAVTVLAHDAATKTIKDVRIKYGAFIGAGAVILPGVTIGERAIIGAGSVVVSDIGNDVKAAGVPAKRIG